jgi:hypothetical protein
LTVGSDLKLALNEALKLFPKWDKYV